MMMTTTTRELLDMLLCAFLLTAVFKSLDAESGSTPTEDSATVTSPTKITTRSSLISLSSLASPDSSSEIPLSIAGLNSNTETCSSVESCISSFEMIYGSRLNETATNLNCPNATDLRGGETSCLDVISYNCNSTSDFLTSNASYFGIVCTNDAGLQMLSWNQCNDSVVVQIINEWTGSFCRSTPDNVLNCSVTSSGLYSVDRNALIMPFIKSHNCTIGTNKRTTTPVPLLPNPVSPSAVTAIIVLGCLLISAILGGFFFWPKCHTAKDKTTTKKTKVQPLQEQVSVAYASSPGPTGEGASIDLQGPHFLGSSAA